MKSGDAKGQKLMDHLGAVDLGDPIVGILSTTFELQQEFVEMDFLPAVFKLGAWDNHSWASYIAVERRLAELDCAVFFQAAGQFRGRPRSLRVEVVPVPSEGLRVLHAKVTLIVGESSLRLLVASANLTEPGYRRNREVVIPLSASAQRLDHIPLIRACLERMPEALRSRWTPSATELTARATELLNSWSPTDPDSKDEWFAWGGLESPLWSQFIERWPVGEQIGRIVVVSPFWSQSTDNGPLGQLLEELKRRGVLSTRTDVQLVAEAGRDATHQLRPVLPLSYAKFDLRRYGVKGLAQAADPSVDAGDTDGGKDARPRALHAKVVLFEGTRTTLGYAGSANFTRFGWGFVADPRLANIEAGVIVRRTGKARDELRALVPETIGQLVVLDGSATGQLVPCIDEYAECPWPAFIRRVYLTQSAVDLGKQDLEVEVDPVLVDGAWSIAVEASGAWGITELFRSGAGEPILRRVELNTELHTRLLSAQRVVVSWWDHPAGASYPLNVDQAARGSLPVAPEGGMPGEHLLLQYYQSKIAFEDLFPPPPGWKSDEDERQRAAIEAMEMHVDTSKIQSYQVREFVEALRGIQDDLQRATSAPGAMRLALLGPVSPVALAQAIVEATVTGKRSPTAAAFQLTEILSCLRQSKAANVPERYRKEWEELAGEAERRVEGSVATVRLRSPAEFTAGSAFDRYETAIEGLHANVTAAVR